MSGLRLILRDFPVYLESSCGNGRAFRLGEKKASKILPFRDPYEKGDSALVFL